MATKPTTGRSKNVGAATDVLSQLAALAPTTAPPKAGKPTKWELPLTPEAKVDAERWVGGKSVLEPVEKWVENAKNELMEYCLRQMSERIFANKTKPSNPLIVLYKEGTKTPDHQLQVTMTDKFKYRFPDVPQGVDPRDHFVEIFVGLGLHPTDAEKLVDNELDFNPVTGVESLTMLMEGYYGEGREWIDASPESKVAGQKFANLLLWDGKAPLDPANALTPEEKMMVIKRSPGMQVKAGFYDRVATYCQSVDQLMGVFKVIQPIIYPAYVKFALNDSETDKTRRKIEAAAAILGTVTVDSKDS